MSLWCPYLRLRLLYPLYQLHRCDLGYQWGLCLRLRRLCLFGQWVLFFLWDLWCRFGRFVLLHLWCPLHLLHLFDRCCQYHLLTQGLLGQLCRYFLSDHRDPLCP